MGRVRELKRAELKDVEAEEHYTVLAEDRALCPVKTVSNLLL